MKNLIYIALILTSFTALGDSTDVQVCSTIQGAYKNEMSCVDTRDMHYAKKVFNRQSYLRKLKDEIKAKGLEHKWEEYRKTNPHATPL